MKLELLMAIVHNEKAAYFSSLIQSHQANLQFSMPAKGTTHLVLSYLGLTEQPKTQLEKPTGSSGGETTRESML